MGEPQAAAVDRSEALPRESVADLIGRTPAGSIQLIAGMGSEELRQWLDSDALDAPKRSALFISLSPASLPEEFAEQIIDAFARAALASWPIWYGGAHFGEYRAGTLEREAARLRMRAVAGGIAGVSESWARQAIALSHGGRLPRVAGCPAAVELGQLGLALNPAGTVVVTGIDNDASRQGASLVQAMEWAARKAGAAVVLLCPELPGNGGGFGRVLYGAKRVETEAPAPEPASTKMPAGALWLAPVLGRPHPLSQIEQRLAAELARDAELAPLFSFNQRVRTVRGAEPRVDLLWREGCLVVELDGYPDHNTREAFARDRHRDYELTLSGYTVLRIANDEAALDIGRTVEKIRDMVHLRRSFSERRSGT